jgi:tRNA A-37 threonylcarbamoyl transferase component Bud32
MYRIRFKDAPDRGLINVRDNDNEIKLVTDQSDSAQTVVDFIFNNKNLFEEVKHCKDKQDVVVKNSLNEKLRDSDLDAKELTITLVSKKHTLTIEYDKLTYEFHSEKGVTDTTDLKRDLRNDKTSPIPYFIPIKFIHLFGKDEREIDGLLFSKNTYVKVEIDLDFKMKILDSSNDSGYLVDGKKCAYNFSAEYIEYIEYTLHHHLFDTLELNVPEDFDKFLVSHIFNTIANTLGGGITTLILDCNRTFNPIYNDYFNTLLKMDTTIKTLVITNLAISHGLEFLLENIKTTTTLVKIEFPGIQSKAAVDPQIREINEILMKNKGSVLTNPSKFNPSISNEFDKEITCREKDQRCSLANIVDDEQMADYVYYNQDKQCSHYKKGDKMGTKSASGVVYYTCCGEETECNHITKIVKFRDENDKKKFHREIMFQQKATKAGLAPAIIKSYITSKQGIIVMEKLSNTLSNIIHDYLERVEGIVEKLEESKDADETELQKTIDGHRYVTKAQGYALGTTIGNLLVKLHQLGIYHNDAHMNNFMTDDNGKFYFIDFGEADTVHVIKKRPEYPLRPYLIKCPLADHIIKQNDPSPHTYATPPCPGMFEYEYRQLEGYIISDAWSAPQKWFDKAYYERLIEIREMEKQAIANGTLSSLKITHKGCLIDFSVIFSDFDMSRLLALKDQLVELQQKIVIDVSQYIIDNDEKEAYLASESHKKEEEAREAVKSIIGIIDIFGKKGITEKTVAVLVPKLKEKVLIFNKGCDLLTLKD